MLPAASYLGRMLRLAARGFAERGKPARLPKERLAVERSGIRVAPRSLARYLRVTDGEGIAGFAGADAPLPPAYPALWETALALELLARPSMPPVLGGVIHLESECLPLRALHVGDLARCRLELERAEPDPRGVRLHLLSRNWNAPGQLCSENRMTLLLRGATPPGRREERSVGPHNDAPQPPPGETPPGGAWHELARWSLRGGHGRRYARVSGDYNPVHLWSLTARAFGYRRPILHGYCTQAMVAHALVRELWEGDPTRLRRLLIAFRAPLLLPARLALLVDDAPLPSRFRVVGAGTRTPARLFAEGSFLGR